MKFIAPLIYLMCFALLPSIALAKEEQQLSKPNHVVQQNPKVHQAPIVQKKPLLFHSGIHIVTIDRLNIRSQPTTQSRVIGGLHRGMKVNVVGQHGVWRKIQLRGHTEPAWVYSTYLKLIH